MSTLIPTTDSTTIYSMTDVANSQEMSLASIYAVETAERDIGGLFSDIKFKSGNISQFYDIFKCVDESIRELELVTKVQPRVAYNRTNTNINNLFVHIAQNRLVKEESSPLQSQDMSAFLPSPIRWARHDGARKDRLYGKVRDLGMAVNLLKQTTGSGSSSTAGNSCTVSVGGQSPTLSAITISTSTRENSQTSVSIAQASIPQAPIRPPTLRKRMSSSPTKQTPLRQLPSRRRGQQSIDTNFSEFAERDDVAVPVSAFSQTQTQSSLESNPVDPFVAAAYALMNLNPESPRVVFPLTEYPTTLTSKEPAPILGSLRKRRSAGNSPHIVIPASKRGKFGNKGLTSPTTDTSFLYSPPISEDGALLRNINRRSSSSSSAASTPTKPSSVRSTRRFSAKEIIVLPEIDDNDDFYAESEDEKEKHLFHRRSTPVSTNVSPTKPCSAKFLNEQREKLQDYLAKAGVVAEPMEVTSAEEGGVSEETDAETDDDLAVSRMLCEIKGSVV
ncbi:UNVERIFIED_CONTAM: hypothetical protein HDU68_000314 [Siphonaria sp. JEL0065]|nr:hypothetical protein HDU68_000314 [Siphonaria sp. JEL0065]